MQEDGLPVVRYSKWKFVRGSDLVEFLARQAEAAEQAEADREDTVCP
jgi:hypothetical protein